jgi:DNA repair ATPase RecN
MTDFQALLQQLDTYSEELNEQQRSVCEAYNRIDAIGFAVEAIGREAVPKHSDDILKIRKMVESNNEKINRLTHAILNELKAWDGLN